ncbi:DUF455 family protein [Pseudomonas viridiflava]|nr:DUF455 family protein [Pseudomonas viridiflava]
MSSSKEITVQIISDALHCGLQGLRASLLCTPSTQEKLALCDAIYALSHARVSVCALADEGHIDVNAACAKAGATSLTQGGRAAWDEYFSTVLTQTVELEAVSSSCNCTVRWALQEAARAMGTELMASPLAVVGTVFKANPVAERALVPEFPARETPAKDPGKARQSTLLSDLHRQIFGIEISAAEITASIPLRFAPLPPELDHLLAVQTFEEGRHARLFLSVFLDRGGRLEDYAHPTTILDKFNQAGSLAEALYIEQVLGEGYSIGGDAFLASFYENRGDSELAAIYRYSAADELMHAKHGLEWFRRIAGADAAEIAVRLQKLAGPVPGKDWFFHELRRRIGFTEEEISHQRNISISPSALF